VSVLFLLTAPPPRLEGTDAVLQEVEALRARFDGAIVHTAFSPRPWARVPRLLYGLQKARRLRRLAREASLVHIYHAALFDFPVLRLLRKPTVYSVVTGLGGSSPSIDLLRRLDAVVVPTQDDLSRLRRLGVSHGHVVTAGIDTTRLTIGSVPRGDHFVLMSASAPWTLPQFGTKGVDALLDVARAMPFLRLILLWRGWLVEEIRRRVAEYGLTDRVEVLNERVDVNEVLGRVHGAIVLAEDQRLVKAFPHSLLEALACGKPIIVSDGIALAEYVDRTQCGLVVKGVERSGLADAVGRLRRDYSRLRANALRVGRRDFTIDNLVDGYAKVYASVLGLEPAAPALRSGPRRARIRQDRRDRDIGD
jgi:glycosyltransferase involved in cell wall biosynthesis